MSRLARPICYGDIVYIQCDDLVLMANGQYSPFVHLNSTENVALKSFRNGLFMLYPNLTYKDITQVEHLEHQLDLLVSLNPEEKYAAEQLQNDIKKEKLILEEREAKLVALNDKMFEEAKGEPIKYHQKVQLYHIESKTFVGLSNAFDKDDKSMNYLELTKEGSKNLYFEFLPKLEIQEREVVDYDTPVLFVSNKSKAGLKLGGQIEKSTIKTELNPSSNTLCNGSGDFPDIAPRRTEPIYQTEKVYATGISETAGTENIVVKKFLSHEDQVKAESKKYLKNGDYIRIATSKFYLTMYQHRNEAESSQYFQAFGINQEYKRSNIYTLFQIIDVTDSQKVNEEGIKEQFNLSKLPQGDLLEYSEKNRYLLKHFVSGKFLVYRNSALKLVDVKDAFDLPKVSLVINGRSDSDQFNNYIDKNAVLQVRFYDNDGKEQGSLQLGAGIKIPNAQLDTNTWAFYGFKNTDNYLNKWLRTERFQANVTDFANITNNNFKFERVTDEEVTSIHLAESFVNEIQRFSDFLCEFSAGRVESIKEFNKNIQKLANLCTRYAQEMYEGEYNEALEDILIPNNLRQTLLREFRIYNLLYPILKYLIETSTYKTKIEQLLAKCTDEGRAHDDHHHHSKNEIPPEKSKKKAIDDIHEVNYVHFELLIRGIKKLIINSFKKNDFNHYFCSQFIRVPINCLTKDKDGVTGLIPDRERKQIKGYMLELCKQGLWDQDLDALGQLNFYEAAVFGAIESQGTFHAFYIQLMQHISSSKAPNLLNSIRDNMVFNFLGKDANMKHLFPRLYEENGKIYLEFTRKNHEDAIHKLCLAGDLVPATPKDLEPEITEEKDTLVHYFQESLKLIFALNRIDSSMLKLKIMRYYTFESLTMAIQILKASTRFRELRSLMSDLLNTVHQDYLSIPFVKLPKQLQILDQDTSLKAKIQHINTFISNAVKTSITDSEKSYLKDEDAEGIIKTVTSNIDLGDQTAEIIKLMLISPSIESFENARILIEEIKKLLGSHIEVSFEFLKRARHIIVSLINQALSKEGKMYIDFIQQALEVFHEMDAKTVAYAATEITGELKHQYLSNNPNPPSPTKLKTPKSPEPLRSARSNNETLYTEDDNLEMSKLTGKKPTLSTSQQKEKTDRGNISESAVATSTLGALARKWKTGERFLDEYQTKANQPASANPLITGNERSQVLLMQENLQTSKSYTTLLDIFLLNQQHLKSVVIQQLRKLSAFESNLYRELEKLTILQDYDSLKEVEEIIQITFRLNEIAREIYFCKDTLMALETSKLDGFLKEVLENLWKLFFIIYDTSKHFRYPDDNYPSSEKRFRDAFEAYKKPRWDKVLTLNPLAINKSVQKMFNILKVYQPLFKTQAWILDKKTGFDDAFLTHTYIFRLNALLLHVFVQSNKENQALFSNSHGIIRQFYNQHFLNQSPDAMLVFSEMMKSNKRLLKLPYKYLYDITLSTFVGTMPRSITNNETNGYLAAAIMSLGFLAKSHIPIELYNPLTDLKTKFLEATNCDNFYSLDVLSSTADVFPEPYCYYSIRGIYSAFLEIYDHLAADVKAIKDLQAILLFEEWLRIFQSKNFLLQYELKNLAAKCFIKNYFKNSSKSSPILQDTSECLRIVSSLLADVLFFRTYMAKKRAHSSIELVRLTETPSFILNHESFIKVNEAYKQAKDLDFTTKKLQIFLEDIPLENLFIEYIYEGCLDLLFNILLKFPKYGSEVIDTRNEAKSLIAFTLEVISEFVEGESSNKNFPFKKIEGFLSKASSIKEYIHNRPSIIKITNVLYVKSRMNKKVAESKIKHSRSMDAHQTYTHYITPLYNFKRESKEQNIKQVAEHIAEHPRSKDIISEVVMYLKRDINKLDHEEIVFILRLLRKYIEIENCNNPEEDPIYMWKEVSYVDLKKIERVQNSYRDLGLSPLLYHLFSMNDFRIFKETILLSLAYMYGGNTNIQRDFFENFKNDDENKVIRKIRERLESYWDSFKKTETKRVDTLYHTAHKTLFDYFTGKKQDSDVNFDQLQFVVSKMKLDRKTIQLAERDFGNEQFLLILSFFQCLCEKQFTPMQNFLREQKVDDHVFAKSFDLLNFLRHGMNSYYKVLCRYNLSVGNKILDLIIELIQGEVHENITVLLHKTFVHDLCRILTDYNSRYHTLPRGFGLNIFHENFREFKSKVIFIFKTMLENKNEANLVILAEHLDISGLMNTFLDLMTDFVTKNKLQKKINSTTRFIYALKNEDFKDTLGDAINIYIIFRYLWDDPNVFNERLRTQISLLDKSKQDFMDKIVNHIFPRLVRSIEINVENKNPPLIRIWYPTIAMCHYLHKDTKYAFTKQVDRSNTQTKISALIDSSQEFIPQMNTDYQARNRVLGFNLLNFYYAIRLLSNAIALFITFFNVGTYTYDSGNDEAIQEDKYTHVTKVLNSIQIGFAVFLVVCWIGLLSQRNRTVKWEKYVDQNVKTKGFLPPSLKNKLDNGDYKDLNPEDCQMVMELEGANSDEFKEMKKSSKGFKKIVPMYLLLEAWFTFASKIFLWHLIYVGICIGSIFHPLVAVFQILDIAIRADTIVQIYASISRNVYQFLWTLFLLVVTNVTYALIGFFFLNGQFQTTDNDPVVLCETAFSCFLNVLNLGLRSGGGIGDVIGPQAYSHDHIGLFIARVIFDLSFFIIMIILLLNLIFGMIIDAFGDLRDQKTSNDEDEKNVCFICGIDRSEFERHVNFDQHTQEEHNIWSYVFYLVYLIDKQRVSKTEMTDIENAVLERYLIKNYEWVPIGKSLTLQKISERENVQKEDNIEYMTKKIELMQADVTNINKQLNTSLIGDLKAGINELNTKVQVNQKPAYITDLFKRVDDMQKILETLAYKTD